MASRTLFQLLILTIIYIEQIEIKALNKTDNLDDPVCLENYSSVNERSEKGNKSDRNDTVLNKKSCTDHDQRSDTNLESQHDILTKNRRNHKKNHVNNEETDSDKTQEQESDKNITSNTKIASTTEITSLHKVKQFSNEKKHSEHASDVNSNNSILVPLGQKTAVKKIKQESATELETNDESSLQKNTVKKSRPTVQRQKRLRVRHHNTKVTTEAMTDKLLIPKATPRSANEVNNDISKTKHCDDINRSFEKISREYDIYRLKHRDETKTVSKRATKLKHSKRNRTSKRITLPENMSESKHSDHSDTLTNDNKIYKQEHLDESVKVPVTQMKPKRKTKFTNNVQKKNKNKVTKKVIDDTKHKSKNKHRSNKEKSKKGKKKPTLDSKTEKHTDLRSGDSGSINSEGILNANEADTQTQENHVIKDIQNSSEELFNEKDFLNKPLLPFYVSSTTLTTNEKAKKHPIKRVGQKEEEKDTKILLDDLNTILKGDSDLTNQKIDINKTIDRLATSKILDLITDHLLKKLQNNQAFHNKFRRTNVKPEKGEQHPINRDEQKDEKKDTDILLDGLNAILNGNSDLTNQKNDINKTINRLLSSKILDFITEHMPKKLQNSQAYQNNFERTNVKPEKGEQHPIKRDAQKGDKKDTEILLDNLNAILKGKSDLTNQKIDINKTIDRLASSELLSFITDHILKTLQNSQAFQNNFRRTNVKPEKVEHIDILFKRNGDMVMMSRENLKEREHEVDVK